MTVNQEPAYWEVLFVDPDQPFTLPVGAEPTLRPGRVVHTARTRDQLHEYEDDPLYAIHPVYLDEPAPWERTSGGL